MTRALASLLILLATSIAGMGRAVAGDVAHSPHNLSASGPGPVRAATEKEVCVFCHTSHNSTPRGPLWNRRDPGTTYTTYTSSTLKVAPGQPSGASRQCLSCHDGTIALGEVVSRRTEIAMAGGLRHMPPGRGLVGVDLSGDHPVSFEYATSRARSGPVLADAPSLRGKPLLDRQGALQCTSCHDPHDNDLGSFLIAPNAYSAVCTACHRPEGWERSSHATSSRTWSGTGPSPWPGSKYRTVAENGCGSCHTPHKAGGRRRLLRSGVEKDNCLPCHDGRVALKDVAADFGKWSAHPIGRAAGAHDAAEVPDGSATHVECVDCHEPHHSAGTSTPASGGLPGPLAGVNGLSISGAPLDRATAEHEVCLKCHADDRTSAGKRVPRLIDQPNLRLRFQPSNPSSHAVAAPGRAAESPSLRTPFTPSSTLRCTSCHGSDSSAEAGGTGPAGPHGSRWDFLLERRYDTADDTSESPQAYALCYKCHERGSILGDQSFPAHRKHVVDGRAPCSVCHDPHGIYSGQGNPTENAHLINFDARVVKANGKGQLRYRSTGRFRGECSLTCHGKDHDGLGY